MKLWKIFRQKYKYALRWYRNLQFWFYIENLFPRTIKLSFPSRRCSFFIFLNSAGKTEARPTDFLQPYSPEENGSFLWLGELENPNPNRKESGLGDEKFLNLQTYTTDDNATTEGLEQPGKSAWKPHLQETGIQDKTSAVGEANSKAIQVSRAARNATNVCIKRFVYRIIYNWVFKIPVCKQGCNSKFRTVNFSRLVQLFWTPTSEV